MQNILMSDAPYAEWLADALATIAEMGAKKIAIVGIAPDGQSVFTGYTNMTMGDKAVAATHIQADAMLDVVCNNGQSIRQAWEDEDNEV